MRNLKKFLAMALTVLMVVGSFSAFTANAAFDDVTDYQEAIEVMSTLGIIKGYDEATFGPDDDVTRWQMALLITKMMTGKVSDEYVEINLKNPENLTAFTDITADNYIGSINYANNNGIVKGVSADKYAPNDGIKLEDVFTMVVRMLGYGSTAMDNNYPWSYIDKAISLGLDAGLPADYSNEAVATRGEAAQILFNALTAVKADASTLGADFFNLQKATVVITGTKKANMYNNAAVVTKTVDSVDYVAFCKLSAEGTVDSSYTYYIPKTAFGLAADANANAFVGDSFVVRTNDDFASFLTCEACEKTIIDQDALVGTGTSSSDNAIITINGDKYNLVKAYTYLNNGQGAKNTNTEIILNDANGTRSTSYATDYVLDKNLNILDENRNILLHWVTTYGLTGVSHANLNGTYLYQVGTDPITGDPLYVEPNDYIWSMAARATLVADTAKGFGAITESYKGIEQYDAYSTTVLYDDDADGDYDRGVYYQFQFGKAATYTKDSAAWLKITTSGVNTVDDKVANLAFYDAEGNAVTADSINGKYVLYYYQKAYKTVVIKEVFAGQTGLVTGINLATKTLTLNALGVNLITGIVTGENLTIGNANLFGATFEDIVGTYSALEADKMIGKNINFIEKDGKILAIYNYADAANYMVFVNDNSGFTTMGYKTALVYFDPVANKSSNTRSTVTFNATSTYWYSTWTNVAVATDADKYQWYHCGDLLTATKDALGNYDASFADYDYEITKNKGSIVFHNGVLSFIGTGAGATKTEVIDLKTDEAAALPTGKATADTVIIVYGGNGYDDFQTFKGIPANNAAIDVYKDAEIKYVTKSNGDIDFLYINGGKMDRRGATFGNPWNWSQTSTIIYVDGAAKMTQDGNNVLNTGAGMYLGTVFDYTNVVDAINGGYVDVKWSSDNYTARLETGNFYYVKDGYVVNKVDLDDDDSPIKKVFVYDSYKENAKYETKVLVPGLDREWTDYTTDPSNIKKYESDAGDYYYKITNLNTGAVEYKWNEFTYDNSFATIYLDKNEVATRNSMLNTKDSALLDILSKGTDAQKDPVQDELDTDTHRTGYYAYAYVPTWTWRYETNVYNNSEWPAYENFPVFLANTPNDAVDLPANTPAVIKYAVQIKGYDQDSIEAFDPTAAFENAYKGNQIKIFKALKTPYGDYIKGAELKMDDIANIPGDTLYPDDTIFTDDVFDYERLLQKAYVLENTIKAEKEAELPAFIIAVKNDIKDKITISYEIQVDDPATAYGVGEGDNSEVINIKPTTLTSSDLDVNWTYYVVQTTSKMIVHEANAKGNAATPYIINKDDTDECDLYAINIALTVKGN